MTPEEQARLLAASQRQRRQRREQHESLAEGVAMLPFAIVFIVIVLAALAAS